MAALARAAREKYRCVLVERAAIPACLPIVMLYRRPLTRTLRSADALASCIASGDMGAFLEQLAVRHSHLLPLSSRVERNRPRLRALLEDVSAAVHSAASEPNACLSAIIQHFLSPAQEHHWSREGGLLTCVLDVATEHGLRLSDEEWRRHIFTCLALLRTCGDLGDDSSFEHVDARAPTLVARAVVMIVRLAGAHCHTDAAVASLVDAALRGALRTDAADEGAVALMQLRLQDALEACGIGTGAACASLPAHALPSPACARSMALLLERAIVRLDAFAAALFAQSLPCWPAQALQHAAVDGAAPLVRARHDVRCAVAEVVATAVQAALSRLAEGLAQQLLDSAGATYLSLEERGRLQRSTTELHVAQLASRGKYAAAVAACGTDTHLRAHLVKCLVKEGACMHAGCCCQCCCYGRC